MPSLSTPSLLLLLPFTSVLSLICLCASSFSSCQSTRRAIYVPLPMSVSKSGLHRSSQGRECAGAFLNRESQGGLMCVQQQDSPTLPLSASAMAH